MSTSPQPASGVPVCYRHPGREAHIRCQRCSRPICPDCMTSASVGFHCPECVAEGRRTTRSVRTRYGGLIPGNASVTSMVIIGINAVICLLINLTGRYSSSLYNVFSMRPEGTCIQGDQYYPNISAEALCARASGGAAEWVPGVSDGAYWQLITSGFGHVGLLHLAMNCFFIYMVGPQLEGVLGRTRFLALYGTSLLAGSTLVYWAADPHSSTLGASGAAFGLLAAMLVVCVKERINANQIIFLIVINFALTFTVSGISWQGHLGGFLGGAVAAAALVYAPSGPTRNRIQVAGVTAVVVACVALIAARTAGLG